MKSLDAGAPARPSIEGLSKERLLINPFPGILSEPEFQTAKNDGKNFWQNYSAELENDALQQSEDGNFWGLYETRIAQNEFHKNFSEGKITADFGDTIFLEDPILSSGASRKIAAASIVFEGMTTASSDYNEDVSPEDLYELYEQDSSGKSIAASIALEKVRHLYRILKTRNPAEAEKDIIGTDVGVLVPDDGIEPLKSAGDPDHSITPTHRFLQKPTSRQEMQQMLRYISGKKIIVITSIAVKYQILKESGPIIYRNANVEVEVPVKELSDSYIDAFVENYFDKGRNIAGGVDYTSFGSEIIESGIPLKYDEVITPVKEIKKLWAQVQIIKRAAQMQSVEASMTKS